MKLKWMAISLLASVSSQAYATLIYDDGNTHQIGTTIFEDIRLENGTDLDVMQGGVIQATADLPAITRGGPSASTINLSGDASVVGGIHYENWGNDDDVVIASDDAQVLAQGETISGFGRGAVTGARGVEVSGNARLAGAEALSNGGSAIDNNGSSGGIFAAIHGGEVVGGDGGQIGGNGIDGWIEVVNLEVSDGSIQGGDGSTQGGHGIYSFGTISGEVSGGLICGGDSATTGGDAIFSRDGVSLDISGGSFQGGSDGTYGGNAIKSSGDQGANTTISGGEFDAGRGLVDDGWLLSLTGSGHNFEISGGLFGQDNIGRGFGIFNHANLDVHGWDLELNDNLLTGYLLDGSWIETTVELALNGVSSDNDGTINLINHESPVALDSDPVIIGSGPVVIGSDPVVVTGTDLGTNEQTASVPEPSSLMLLAIGLAGAWTTRRKKAINSGRPITLT
jgi:hypothetical protein